MNMDKPLFDGTVNKVSEQMFDSNDQKIRLVVTPKALYLYNLEKPYIYDETLVENLEFIIKAE